MTFTSYLSRAPEILRCQRETKQWLPVTLSYLGISKLTFPFSLQVRGMPCLQLRELYDLKTFWQIFVHRCYKVHSTERTIIDAGANIGLFTLYAARNAPSAKIWAIEPFPSTYNRLVEAVTEHGLRGRVECLDFALCGSDEPRSMKNATKHPSQMQRLAPKDAPGAISVKARTLPAIIERVGSKIDLLKMDIEGAEYEVLLNTGFDDLRKIQRIVLEYHGDVRSYTREQLFTYLDDAGFDILSDDRDDQGYGVAELLRRPDPALNLSASEKAASGGHVIAASGLP